MSDHHPHGPSTLNFKRMCHAYENHSGDTAAAEEGTLLHAVLETGDYSACTAEQADLIHWVEDELRPMVEAAEEDHREIRLDIKLGNGHSTFGTCDRLLLTDDGKLGDLIDYKMGRLSIPQATDNLQGLAYAIGAFQKFPELEIITVRFLQPRRHINTRMVYIRSRLDFYVGQLTRLFDKITADKPKRTACKACEYCAKLADCWEAQRRIVHLVALKRFKPPRARLPEKMTLKTLDEYFLPMARIAKGWAAQVEKRAKDMLLEGETMNHHEIAERRAPKKKPCEHCGELPEADNNEPKPKTQKYLRRK